MSISFFAEEDQIEQVPVPHDKILDCMTACIHAANIKDTLEQRKNLMHVLTTALSSGFPWTGTLFWPTFFFFFSFNFPCKTFSFSTFSN
jgi:hypothetical protein